MKRSWRKPWAVLKTKRPNRSSVTQKKSDMARKVYAWLLNLLKQEEVMLVKLSGTPNEESMAVFDLNAAGVRPKRTIIRKSETDA